MRRRTRNRLILAVLLLAALPFALKGLMWWRVKLAVDDFIAHTGDQAVIDYREIETGWDGAASVLGVRVRPRTLDHAITVARVRLETADPLFLFDPRRWFTDRRIPPEQLTLAAFGVRVPLAAIQARQRRTTGTEISAQSACSRFTLEPGLLRAMGMQALTLDLHSRYAFDRPARRLDMELALDLHEIEHMAMQVRLRDLLPEDLQEQRLAQVRLDSARLVFEIEPEFGQRLSRHCAEQLGLADADAYIEQQLAQTRTELAAAGIEIGEALQQALTTYQRQWGRIELEIRPPELLAPLQLVNIPPEQIVARLGMSLMINGRPVVPLEVRIRPPVAKESAPEAASSPDAAKPAAGFRVLRRYRPGSVARLGDHLGQKVRIRPRGQPPREGVLVALVNGEAQLEQRVPGGSMEAYIPLDEIESVEIEERVKVPWRPASSVPAQ